MNPITSMLGVLSGALLTLTMTASALRPVSAQQPASGTPTAANTRNDPDFYVGMWVTADGTIRHKLLPGGRYDEARGGKQSAYRGSYRLKNDHIDYRDDTGFTADGEFRGGMLYHGGMVLYREKVN